MDKDELLASLTDTNPAPETAPEAAEIQAEETQTTDDTAQQTADDTQSEQTTDEPKKSAAEELLATLTDEPKKEEPKEEAKPEVKDEPKTPEQEEAELLDGIKSERGKERVKAMIASRKEAEAKAQQFETDIKEFQDMVRSTGMAPQEFAQMLEFGRLINSGSEDSARVALKMLDDQREALCKRLGIDAPGVDPLSDFPDLKQAVDTMEVSRERALELAKFRRIEQQRTLATQQEQARTQDMTQYQQKLDGFRTTAEAYFKTREKEVDFPAKMKRMHEYFASPQNMQDFVASFEPHQWGKQLQFMYENMAIAQPSRPTDQPLRSRPANTGRPAPSSDAPLSDRLMANIDALGI